MHKSRPAFTMHNNNLSVYGINNNKRTWSKCNELLVRLMKDIIDLKDIGNYKDYLKEQNRKKNGKLFIIPDRIIEFITRIRSVFKALSRSLESYRWIFQEILGIPETSFLSISRRIRKIEIPEIMHASSSAAVDSKSFKIII